MAWFWLALAVYWCVCCCKLLQVAGCCWMLPDVAGSCVASVEDFLHLLVWVSSEDGMRVRAAGREECGMGQHGKVRHAVIDSLACCLALGHGDVISGNPSGPQCRQVASRGAARMLGGRGYAPAQDARGCTFAARALGGAGFSGRAH